jgi:hypothetical protein
MDTKLTLKLDDNIIEKAKVYAKKRKTSLSKLIETYLDYLTSGNMEAGEITPLVKSLSGVLNLTKNYDYMKSYKDHILKKYSK